MTDTHQKQCGVCKYGPDELDWGLSNVALSQIIDCSEASIRRHKKWAEANGFDLGLGSSSTETEGAPDWVDTTGVPRRAWQLADGTWRQSFQYAPSEEGVTALIDNERINNLILGWPMTKLPTAFTPGVECAFPADLQLGKAGEAGGGTPETIARFQASMERVAQRWEVSRPEHGLLADMGDLVENLFSTPSQVSTVDRSLPEQVEDAVALYVNAIGRLLPLVGTLHVATVTSNHGEARNAMKVNPFGSENDWGLMIFRLVKTMCEARGWDVVFHRPERNEDTAVVEFPDGTKVALTHGHHSGTPQRMKEWVKNQIVGRRPGWDADVWVAGHYHHDYHFPVGDGRIVFGTPSLDGGSAWFTRKSGEVSPPGVMCLTLANHGWSNYSIL